MYCSENNQISKNNSIGCVIMASGEGKRFGGNKLMTNLCQKPMIGYAVDTAKAVFDNILVVTRHENVAEFCRQNNIDFVLHNFPGRNDTVRLGIEKFDGRCDGCIFCQGDQPLISVSTLQKMAETFDKNKNNIIRLEFDGVPSSPTIFPKDTFPALLTLPEGKGGNVIVKNNPDKVIFVSAQDRYETFDIDTKEDFAEIETVINEKKVYSK